MGGSVDEEIRRPGSGLDVVVIGGRELLPKQANGLGVAQIGDARRLEAVAGLANRASARKLHGQMHAVACLQLGKALGSSEYLVGARGLGVAVLEVGKESLVSVHVMGGAALAKGKALSGPTGSRVGWPQASTLRIDRVARRAVHEEEDDLVGQPRRPGLDSPDLISHGSGPGIHVLERCPLNEVRLGRERTGGVAAIRGSAGLRQDEARLALACWHLALAWLHLI